MGHSYFRCILGLVDGLMGASWGLLGGLLHFRLLKPFEERLRNIKIRLPKPVKSLGFLDTEANFCRKKHMVFVKVRVTAAAERGVDQKRRMSPAFWPFLKRKEGAQKEEGESRKGRGRRNCREEKTKMLTSCECPTRFAHF